MFVIRWDYEVKTVPYGDPPVLYEMVIGTISIGAVEGERDHLVEISKPVLHRAHFEELSEALERIIGAEGTGAKFRHTRAGAKVSKGLIRIESDTEALEAVVAERTRLLARADSLLQDGVGRMLLLEGKIKELEAEKKERGGQNGPGA